MGVAPYLHQKQSSENQPKRRSPRKRHLNTEFAKLDLKKLTPERIDVDSPPENNFKSNQQSSSIVCENCERLSFENVLLNQYYPNFELFHKNLTFGVFLSVDNYFTFKNSKKYVLMVPRPKY